MSKAPHSPKVLPPQGTFPARVFKIIYLGTVTGEYKGEPTTSAKVSITWELPTKTRVFKEGEAPQPFAISKMFSHSMGKKSSLRPAIEGMLGISFLDEEAKGYDLDDILGYSCLLGIAHKESPDGVKAVIKSYAALPEGMACPPPVNTPKILAYDKWDEAYFETLPQWMKDEMKKTPEYLKMKGGWADGNRKDEMDMDTVDASQIPF